MGDAKVAKDATRGLVLDVTNKLFIFPTHPYWPDEPNYMDCGNDAKFDIAGNFTVAMWVKPMSVPSAFASSWWGLASKWEMFSNWTLGALSDTGVHFRCTGLSEPDVLNFSDFTIGQWHHVAGVYDKDGGKLYSYVNGEESVSFVPSTGSIETWHDPTLKIGYATQYESWHGEMYPMDGYIDDVRIYNRALSIVDVITIMNEPIMVGYNAWNPNPKDGEESVAPSTTTLSWTRPEPRVGGETIRCDVMFGTDPCMVIGPNTTQIETYADVNSTTNFSLDPEKIYYWRVDCNDPNGGSPVMTTGHVWSFDTINRAPTVSAGSNRVATLASAATIHLDATVTDDGLPEGGALTYEWTVVSGDSNMVTFDANDVEDPCATFVEAGEYALRLDASDSVLAGNDTVTITIHPVGWDPCGLVAHYEFEDGLGSTIAADTSGYTDPPKDGTLHGNAQIISDNVERSGMLLKVDGGPADCVLVEYHNDLDITTNITLAAWMKADSFLGEDTWYDTDPGRDYEDQPIVGKVGDGQYKLTHRYQPRFRVEGPSPTHGSSKCIAIGPTPLPTDTWFHLAGTYDGSLIKLYINGVEVDSQSTSGTIDPDTSPLLIGAKAVVGYLSRFDGLIDDVRIYERALNANEIADLLTGMIIAWNPSPMHESTGVEKTVTLSWSAGVNAVSHDVYLGTNFNDVNEATDPNIAPCVAKEHPDVNFTPAQSL